MKISKIVAGALFGAVFASNADAALSNENLYDERDYLKVDSMVETISTHEQLSKMSDLELFEQRDGEIAYFYRVFGDKMSGYKTTRINIGELESSQEEEYKKANTLYNYLGNVGLSMIQDYAISTDQQAKKDAVDFVIKKLQENYKADSAVDLSTPEAKNAELKKLAQIFPLYAHIQQIADSEEGKGYLDTNPFEQTSNLDSFNDKSYINDNHEKIIVLIEEELKNAKKAEEAKQISSDLKAKFENHGIPAKIQEILTGLNPAEFAKNGEYFSEAEINDLVVKPVSDAARAVGDALNAVGGSNANVNLANESATAARFAFLSNPFSTDLALAKAIKSLDGLEFAEISGSANGSASDFGNGSALSEIIGEYTRRFNSNSQIWGNIIGAKSSTADGLDPQTYGFNLGFDHAFDSSILGGFFSYARTDAENSLIDTESDNWGLGVYSRNYFGESELDFIISGGVGKNDINALNLRFLGGLDTRTGSGKFDSKFANLAVNYGYVFRGGDAFFIKPFLGVNYSFAKNDDFSVSGDGISTKFESTKNQKMAANLGVEFRNYVSENSFIFASPALEAEILKDNDAPRYSLDGGNTVTGTAKNDKDIFGKLIVGGEYAVNDALNLTIQAGIKANNEDSYGNMAIGFKFRF